MDQPEQPTPVHLEPLDPRVRWVWLLSGLGVVLGLVVVVAVVELLGVLPLPRGAAALGTLILGSATAVAWSQVRYRRWRYALRPHDLWIRQGVVWVKVSVVPLSRLQFVDTRQGPLQRLFGLAEVVVHTASVGTSGAVPGLDARHAERLRERLAEVGTGAQPV